MKKEFLFLICLITAAAVLLAACNPVRPITANQFTAAAAEAGFQTRTHGEWRVAEKYDGEIIIDFIVMATVEDAISLFEQNDVIPGGERISGKNFIHSRIETETEYRVLSRIENTVLKARSALEFIDELESFLNTIGY